MWLTAPENDYRALFELPDPAVSQRVAVCIPVYNRVDLLARTVAALVPQTYPSHLMSVVIGDDGSDEDVTAALAPFSDALDITVLRRERDGYGAGQARNLAASQATADILVFIDADCLPDRDLVLRHAQWHHKAENLVVIGSRHGLDTSAYAEPELRTGTAGLRREAFGTEDPSPSDLTPEDHRRVLHRRSAGQRHGDEAFRSLVSSNFSIRRDRFLEVGGFDETFHRWGGEDVELGWRCHVAGLFTVPEDRAVVFHQLQDDLWDETGRERSKDLNAGVIQNKIPHQFYRKHRKGHIWENPKTSFVILPTVPRRLTELADQIRAQWHTDWEMVAAGGSEEATTFAETVAADPRFVVVDSTDPLDLIRACRGEYVAVLHGDAAIEPRLLMTTLRRLENQRRASAATVGYVAGGLSVTAASDVAHVDQAWDTEGWRLPVFHVARRREWSKALRQTTAIGVAFETVTELSRTAHVRQPLVAVRSHHPDIRVGDPLPVFTTATTRLWRELSRSGPGPGAVKAVGKYVLRRSPTPEPLPPAPPEEAPGRPRIRYVGWTGHDNLGDEALLRAITGALSWGDVQTSKRGDLLLLGGGTLINRGRYIDWLEEQDSPRIERAVFGSGVANPEFWGDREQGDRWAEWLHSCAYVGVRGPISAGILDSWGVDAEVVGDPALLLETTAERPGGRVVVAPARTRGELWGGSDEDVLMRLADLVRDLHNRGHDVHLMASHPDDDGPCLQIMRVADLPDLPYLAGYEDLDVSLTLLASADVVVAERLHAAVLGAAVSTPFVGLEYRPKVRDFAVSVGMEDRMLRTDDLKRLEELVRDTIADADGIRPELGRRVEEHRSSLRSAADLLREVMGR